MTPKESTMAIQASTQRIRAVREEIADMPELKVTCECDYSLEGDPAGYVKMSHYCPLHDTCDYCDSLGVRKDMSDLWTNGPRKGQPVWVCQRCFESCYECGNHIATEGDHEPFCKVGLAECETCNNLEAFRGARFCREHLELAEARANRLPMKGWDEA